MAPVSHEFIVVGDDGQTYKNGVRKIVFIRYHILSSTFISRTAQCDFLLGNTLYTLFRLIILSYRKRLNRAFSFFEQLLSFFTKNVGSKN